MTIETHLMAIALAAALSAQVCVAGEDLITDAREKSGETVPYIVNYNNLQPSYALILFPGGSGIVDPHIEDGKLVYQARDNFLLRARSFIVDEEFVTVTTNSTHNPERIQAIIDDLTKRFPKAQVYLMGTSRGTSDTMELAEYLSEKIAGEIHYRHSGSAPASVSGCSRWREPGDLSDYISQAAIASPIQAVADFPDPTKSNFFRVSTVSEDNAIAI